MSRGSSASGGWAAPTIRYWTAAITAIGGSVARLALILAALLAAWWISRRRVEDARLPITPELDATEGWSW